MKIDRLRKLDQFIDYLESFTEKEIINILGLDKHCMSHEIESQLYNLVLAYNEFLKQPLKKEMFVNEIEKPVEPYMFVDKGKYNQYCKDFRAWEKAEKKVIFQGFEQSKLLYIQVINSTDKKEIEIGFFKNGVKISIEENQDFISYHIETLSGLADTTNGKLKLKNIEL